MICKNVQAVRGKPGLVAFLVAVVVAATFLAPFSAALEVLPTTAPENDVFLDGGPGGDGSFIVLGGPGSLEYQVTFPDGQRCTGFFNVLVMPGGMVSQPFYDQCVETAPGLSGTPGGLDGASVNGTVSLALRWTVGTGGAAGSYSMNVGGKSMTTTLTAAGGVDTVAWNFHLTPTGSAATTSPTMAERFTDDSPNGEFDPNEYRYFADAPAGSDPVGFAGGFEVDCDGPTAEIEGAWVRGATQTLDTYGRFFWGEGLEAFTTFTASTNLGAGAAGTHTDTIPYNNAVGNAFGFRVRAGPTGTEFSVNPGFVPPGLCEIESPDVDNVVLNLDSFKFTVSQAQCSIDPVAFTVVEDIAGSILSGDPTVTIYPATSTTPILEVPISGWTQPQPSLYSTAAMLPPGPYTAIVTGVGFLGVVNLLDAAAFNVPEGPCTDSFFPTDLSPVLDAITSHNSSVSDLFQDLSEAISSLNATNQASFYALCQKILASEGNLTALIEAIDVFINFTNANLTGNFTFNATTQNFLNSFFNGTFDLSIWNQILQNITQHRNGTIEVNNMDYGGLEFGAFLIFLFWILITGWAWWNGFTLLGLTGMVGAAAAFFPAPPITFAALVLLALIAYALEYFIHASRLKGKSAS